MRPSFKWLSPIYSSLFPDEYLGISLLHMKIANKVVGKILLIISLFKHEIDDYLKLQL